MPACPPGRFCSRLNLYPLRTLAYQSAIRQVSSLARSLVRRFSIARGIRDKTIKLKSSVQVYVYRIVIIDNKDYIIVVNPAITRMRAFVSVALVCILLSLPVLADKLRITYRSAGSHGTNKPRPGGHHAIRTKHSGGYLYKTKTSLCSRLQHPMVARLTLEGYAAEEILLTEGPTDELGSDR